MKDQHDCTLAMNHAAVVKRAVARQVQRIAKLEAAGLSTVTAEQALEVLLRVLKLFEEREHIASGQLT